MNKTIDSIASAVEIRNKFLGMPAGKALLHQKYPNDYEYYMFAIELLDSSLNTKEYFIFPIMPSSISYNDIPITSVKKTAGGISVLKTEQFVPKTLSISGTFGRSLKVLIGQTYQDLASSFTDDDNKLTIQSLWNGAKNVFDERIKTGYGCTKLLEQILTLSNQKDATGKSNFLIVYNLAFNQKFFVEYKDFSVSQSLENNMFWNFQIKFDCIASADQLLSSKNKKTSQQLVIDDQIQKGANSAYKSVNRLLNKNLQRIL